MALRFGRPGGSVSWVWVSDGVILPDNDSYGFYVRDAQGRLRYVWQGGDWSSAFDARGIGAAIIGDAGGGNDTVIGTVWSDQVSAGTAAT